MEENKENLAVEDSSESSIDCLSNDNKCKRAKKKMSKNAKIILISSISVVMAIIIGAGTWLAVMFLTPSPNPPVVNSNLSVSTVYGEVQNIYLAEGTIPLDKLLYGANGSYSLEGKPDGVTLTSDGEISISANSPANFNMSYRNNDGKQAVNVTVVKGGVNVTTHSQLNKAVDEGKPVCIAVTVMDLDAEVGTINLQNHLYANGCSINAYAVVEGFFKTKSDSRIGNTGIKVTPSDIVEQVIIRDLHIYGKAFDVEDSLKETTNYGALLDCVGESYDSVKNPKPIKANVAIYNSVFEKGHKNVHMQNAKVFMEGCIVSTAADSTISMKTVIGGYSVITLKNSVVAESLTGAIVSYCMENVSAAMASESFNQVIIEGFFDIYNWKSVDDLSFVPDTEGISIANIANQVAGSVIKKPSQHADMKVFDGDDQWLHLGVVAISTVGLENNTSVTVKDGALADMGFQQGAFPIPWPGTEILKYFEIAGYFNNDEGRVSFDSVLSEDLKSNLAYEMKFGAKK